MVWDRETGEPVYNAIVWQDRRTAAFCDACAASDGAAIQEKTGLIPDAYFSGSKVNWILENVAGARARAEAGKLAFGTVDSWLIWKLTHGKRHVTDVTNASRTMLFNIHTMDWDEDLLRLMRVPRSMLPEVVASSGECGTTQGLVAGIPIAGIAGDQQAALFGQMCTSPGMAKCTYGTGAFMLLNTGTKPMISKNRLLTTVAWKIGGTVEYALEGSMLMAGAVVQWLRDELQIIRTSAEIEDAGGIGGELERRGAGAGVCGAGGSALGPVCSRRAGGDDAWDLAGAYRAGGAGGDRAAGDGCAGGDAG